MIVFWLWFLGAFFGRGLPKGPFLGGHCLIFFKGCFFQGPIRERLCIEVYDVLSKAKVPS